MKSHAFPCMKLVHYKPFAFLLGRIHEKAGGSRLGYEREVVGE